MKPEPEKQPDASDDDAIIEEAKERYECCCDAEHENRVNAVDDLRFLSGGVNQWDDDAVRRRTVEHRPMITVNNLPTYLHQVTNDQRQNKPSIKVHAVDNVADPATAEIIQGLIRHIEYDSNADVAYDTAVNSAAAIGFGYFRLVTEYESETSFDQKLMFKRIRNPLSVRIDPMNQELDGSGMKYCFIESLMDRDEFERQYPDAEANDATLIGKEGYKGWLAEDTVLVTEYYRIKSTEAKLCRYSDGTIGWKDEMPQLPVGVTIDVERTSERRVVEWFKLTAADVLERTEIKCKWIPVFPVYGDEVDIEGKVTRSGIIRHAKDSFKAYNFWITCATEEVALRPRTPYIMAEGQDEGYEADWANANTASFSALVYKPTTVDGLLVPPPQRQPMADIPSGMLAMAMHAADNKKATTGLFDSSLGARGSATSGKQEMAQQRQGDTANFHYSDNLNMTVLHVGRCIVNMMPHYYDGERIVRMLGEDDSAKFATINQQMPEPVENKKTGRIQDVLNDLTVGTYDVTMKAGPGYDTKRQEAAEFMTAAMQGAKDPITSQILTYLAMKSQDIPGAEEAVKMLKKTLPQNIIEPEEGEDENVIQTPKGPLPVDQVPQVLAQLEGQLQQAQALGPELQKEAARVKDEAAGVEAAKAEIGGAVRELKLSQALAKAQADAEAAREECERTKVIADMKMFVGDALQRLESMKQAALTPQPAPMMEMGAEMGEGMPEGGNGSGGGAPMMPRTMTMHPQMADAATQMQQQLVEKLTQAVQLLAAPRRTVLQTDPSGMPVAAVSETMQ